MNRLRRVEYQSLSFKKMGFTILLFLSVVNTSISQVTARNEKFSDNYIAKSQESSITKINHENDLQERYIRYVQRFKQGLNSKESIQTLYNNFDRLTDDIESALKDRNSEFLNLLLKKSEAVKSFTGEIGPSGANFDLTIKKLNISQKELDFDISWYDKTKYCLKIIKIDLWNNSYESLLIFNDLNCLFRFKAKVVTHYNKKDESRNVATYSGGVDAQSVRAITEKFKKDEQPLILYKLNCKKTNYCK